MRFRSRNRAIAAGMIVLFFFLVVGLYVQQRMRRGTQQVALIPVGTDSGQGTSTATPEPSGFAPGPGPMAGDVPTDVPDMPAPTGLGNLPGEGPGIPVAGVTDVPQPTLPEATSVGIPTGLPSPPTGLVPLPSPPGGTLVPVRTQDEQAVLTKIDQWVRGGNVDALGTLAADVVEETHTRALAMYALGRLASADAFERLKAIVENRHDRFAMRETAVYVMVEVFPERTADFLLQKIRVPEVATDRDEAMHDLVLLAFYADREAVRPACRVYDSVHSALKEDMAKGSTLARQVASFGVVHGKLSGSEVADCAKSLDPVVRSNYVSSLRLLALETGGKKGVDELRSIARSAEHPMVRSLARLALTQVEGK